MKKSNSNLLNYIGHLLANEQALDAFLIDPITEPEGQHGLTKAERSILRRTIANLSNKSVNGYTIKRDYSSYRRSLRLLQNVLHNVGSKMVQDLVTNNNTEENQAILYTFSVIYNLPNIASGPVDFTCQTNDYVQKYGGPYAWATPAYTVALTNPNPTIQQVMDAVNQKYFATPVMPYATVKNTAGDLFVSALIPLGVYSITADISNSCYDLQQNPDADFVFWFYSINGRANPITAGNLGRSFAVQKLNPNDTVYWQLIAPDQKYGFQKCSLTAGNEYALRGLSKKE